MANLIEDNGFISLGDVNLRSITPYAGMLGKVFDFTGLEPKLRYSKVDLKDGRTMKRELVYAGYTLHEANSKFKGTLSFGELDWLTFTHPKSLIILKEGDQPITVLDHSDTIGNAEAFLKHLVGKKIKCVKADDETHTNPTDGSTFTVKRFTFQYV